MKWPLTGEPVRFGAYTKDGPWWHLLAVVGGAVWTIGTSFNLISGYVHDETSTRLSCQTTASGCASHENQRPVKPPTHPPVFPLPSHA